MEVNLSEAKRVSLRADLRRRRMSYERARRSKVMLALADDPCVSSVALQEGMDRKDVRKWRDRYLAEGRKGLNSRHRTGRPTCIDPVSRCAAIATACGRPKDFGVAHRAVWTIDVLLETYRKRNPDLDPMSRSSLLRILNKANIRPHRIKMWLHSPDPLFREKVTEICDLYTNPPEDAIVICVDEKTGMQALGRKYPTKQPTVGREGRMDYEYVRNGTRKLLCAFDIRTGMVYGEMRENRRAKDLVEFMDTVATMLPEGKEVHVVWDNLNTHYDGPSKRWKKFNKSHGGRFHFHYTPIHASWVNQVELFFGILQKRVIRYCEYNSLEELDEAVYSFMDHWNQHEAHPFRWTFKGYPCQLGDEAAA